jgi:hypothetical protein
VLRMMDGRCYANLSDLYYSDDDDDSSSSGKNWTVAGDRNRFF